MAERVLSFVLLDGAQTAEPVFLRSVGRGLAGALRSGILPLVVHGMGEYVERVVESEGIFLEKRDGVLLAGSQREADLIDTATRHLNRGIVSIFTDAIVPTVGLVGSDRGLLHAEGKDVTIREADWVFDIIRRGCIPVIAARAAVSERADVPVDPVVVIRALSMAWAGRVEIAMFTTTNLPGIMQGSVPLSWCDLEEAEVAQVASDGRALKALVNQGHTVLLTNTLRYGQPEELRGTIVSEQRP